jgi:hypothetical protein
VLLLQLQVPVPLHQQNLHLAPAPLQATLLSRCLLLPPRYLGLLDLHLFDVLLQLLAQQVHQQQCPLLLLLLLLLLCLCLLLLQLLLLILLVPWSRHCRLPLLLCLCPLQGLIHCLQLLALPPVWLDHPAHQQQH